MQGIDLSQQADIGWEIAPGKGLGRGAAAIGDVAPLAELGDEPGHLGAREAGDLAQVAPQASLLGPAQAEVGEGRSSAAIHL